MNQVSRRLLGRAGRGRACLYRRKKTAATRSSPRAAISLHERPREGPAKVGFRRGYRLFVLNRARQNARDLFSVSLAACLTGFGIFSALVRTLRHLQRVLDLPPIERLVLFARSL